MPTRRQNTTVHQRPAKAVRPRPAKEVSMNAIQFLKQQHEAAKQGFQKIEQARPEERGAVWGRLSPELTLHEEMEEMHLYGPVARDAADEKLAAWPERHHGEVLEAEQLIERIDQGSPPGQDWLVLVQRLKNALERHIQQEEQEIWPRIERVWDAKKLERAGAEMEAMTGQGGRAPRPT
jgi:hypothetical protein